MANRDDTHRFNVGRDLAAKVERRRKAATTERLGFSFSIEEIEILSEALGAWVAA